MRIQRLAVFAVLCFAVSASAQVGGVEPSGPTLGIGADPAMKAGHKKIEIKNASGASVGTA